MSRCILERFSIISFLFVTITAMNVDNGYSNIQNISRTDTVRIIGCRDRIKVKVGSILELKLKATPGTGYQWLQKRPSAILRLLDADNLKFSNPDKKQSVLGQAGYQILHFKVIKKGTEMIQLEYKRVWEKETMNSCKIRITVN